MLDREISVYFNDKPFKSNEQIPRFTVEIDRKNNRLVLTSPELVNISEIQKIDTYIATQEEEKYSGYDLGRYMK